MGNLTYLAANLRHHWRMHLAVAMAVAVATAVLTGALLMGDSVRGSLRDLTLQRLGTIDQVLVTPQLFRRQLASELASTPGFTDHFEKALPALILRGSASTGRGADTRRASELQLVGVPLEFWLLGESDPRGEPGAAGIWITASVARELGVAAGDELLVQLPLHSEIPGDSPLGERTDIVTGRRFRIAGILPDNSLARFDVHPSQQPPRTLFFDLTALARAIEEPEKANAILISGDRIAKPLPAAASEWLEANFHPRLEDYGLEVIASDPKLPVEYVQVSSNALVLSPEVVSAVESAFGHDNIQRVTTYLANTIRAGEKRIPYSTVTGVDSNAEFGPLLDADDNPVAIPSGGVVLNRWAADNLEAKVGDEITIHYYQPESTHGELVEHDPPLKLKLSHIIDLETPEGAPTAAADPRLTPQLEGVTDQESIADWDLPFTLEEEIRRIDEDYWDDYSTTPKAFVAHETAIQAWPTRWGNESLLRIAPPAGGVDEVVKRLEGAIDPASLGFAFLPVKREGLAAASGTTPFDGLFFGFSLFLIAAAVMLIVLLFRLGMEQRASELGLLAAIGFDRRRARRLLGTEGLIVALCGALLGVVLGIFYAWVLVKALTTLWVAAVGSPFLTLKVGPTSLVIGALLGFGLAALSMRRALGRMLRESPQGLLRGNATPPELLSPTARSERRRGLLRRWPEVCLVAAVALAFYGLGLTGESQAGSFFGVGALALAAQLGFLIRYWRYLGRDRRGTGSGHLAQLAMANLARRPGRSALTLGLVAAASFLLLAISSFRLEPTPRGTGEYPWIATSAQPLHYDLASSEGRVELGLSDEADELLSRCNIVALRVNSGEDASCLNLYRAAQPRVLGVPRGTETLAEFGWTTDDQGPPAALAQWHEPLGTDPQGRSIYPVVIDFNTAVYALHLSGKPGAQITIRDGDDRSVTLQVVGLLKNSMLQGDLLISDQAFREIFPGSSGTSLFLFRPGDRAATAKLPGVLESELADYGFDVAESQERLARFLAVQNTYLSTFQSLGGLGLLLGTVGLAVVQLRSVLERRGELALLQAIGFRRRRVITLVLLENLALLGLGLATGGLAALLALVPQWGGQMASIPWGTIALLVAIMLAMGLGACWLATRRTLAGPLLPALRGE